MSTLTTPTETPAETTVRAPFSLYVSGYIARVRGGEIGSLPAVAGLVVLAVVFSALRSKFLTPLNLANLFTQGAAVTVIAMGLVFVLLIGEIDLSAGYTSGVCASVMTLLMTQEPGFHLPNGNPWYVAIPAALVAGALIGTLIGWLVSRLAIPSFVVTLAAYLAFQGVALMLLGDGKNVTIADPTVLKLENSNLAPAIGWALAAVTVAGYAAVRIRRERKRTRRGLGAEPLALTAIRVLSLALLLGAATFLLNLERSPNPARVSLRGVPLVVPLIGILLVAGTFVLDRTRYGRHLYAVGGNSEAARRAGINVARIRISAFVICSTMAAVGGIILASRANSVDPTTGGSDVLLKSVGAAVIGGTSLFGGRGRVINAILGGAVVAVIDNGMALLGWSSGFKFAVTGIVLLAAATVDALSRKWSAAAT